MSQSGYEIWLGTDAGVVKQIIDRPISLSYTLALNDIGILQIVLPGDFDMANVRLDSWIWVYRFIGNLRVLVGNTVFFIREIERQSSNNQNLLIFSAVSAIELLARRIVAYASGTSQANKSGAAETVMKEIVSENLGADAGAGRDLSAYMTIASDNGAGATVTKGFSWDNVLDVLQEISQYSVLAEDAIYFDVVYQNTGKLEFKTYAGLRGQDLSYSSGQGLIVSPQHDNLGQAVYTQDWTSEATYIYAGGQGQEADRLVVSASSADRIQTSVLNLREDFVSATMQSASSGLFSSAQSELHKHRPVRLFTGELMNTPTMRFGIEWNLGDKVTAVFDGKPFDCIINGVSVRVNAGKESIAAKLRQ